jgi:hypothetical protein
MISFMSYDMRLLTGRMLLRAGTGRSVGSCDWRIGASSLLLCGRKPISLRRFDSPSRSLRNAPAATPVSCAQHRKGSGITANRTLANLIRRYVCQRHPTAPSSHPHSWIPTSTVEGINGQLCDLLGRILSTRR